MAIDSKRTIAFTDGWHPTVNPSSRMPVFYFRYQSLFENAHAVLNEVPRPHGGSTIRTMRLDYNGHLKIQAITTGPKWMPWWILASDKRASDLMDKILIHDPIASDSISGKNVSEATIRLRAQFDQAANSDKSLTMGQALNMANETLYRTIFPELPVISFETIQHSQIRILLARALMDTTYSLTSILTEFATREHKFLYGLLGILTGYEDDDWIVEFNVANQLLSCRSIWVKTRTARIDDAILAKSMFEGNLLPASMLLLFLECVLVSQGKRVFHFGNTYGRIPKLLDIMDLSEKRDRIFWLEDDKDSWNFAIFRDAHGGTYPLHLLDLMGLGTSDFLVINALLKESLAKDCQLVVPITVKGWVGALFA